MSQNADILNHMETHGSITPLEALRLYGCFRLSARIYNLRDEGHNIKTDIIERNGKHVARYSLEEKK
jgi:hypothetical protein